MTSPIGLNLCDTEIFKLVILETGEVLSSSGFHTPHTLDDNDTADAVHERCKTFERKEHKHRKWKNELDAKCKAAHSSS